MSLFVFIGLNLLLMAALFAFGVYQFLQVEEKRKRRQLLNAGELDEAALRALLQAERHDEARQRLMRAANVDRFTAEATLARLKEHEVSPS